MDKITVALFECDALKGDTELRGQYLRERRRVTLPVVERSRDQLHRAVVLEHDLAEFDARRRGDFEIGADGDPAQPAALAALLLAPGKVDVIGDFERLVEHALEITAVIDHAGGGIERHLRGLDEIAL